MKLAQGETEMMAKDILSAIPRRTLARHFLLSDSANCIYAATPKVLSSSITLALLQREKKDYDPRLGRIHRDARVHFSKPVHEKAAAIANGSHVAFCAVRDPVSRCLSAYYSKAGIPIFRQQLLAHIGEKGDRFVSVEEFVEIVGDQSDEERDRHWKSQVGILFPNTVPYNMILRQESIKSDWAELSKHIDMSDTLPSVNVSKKQWSVKSLDDHLKQRIADIYKEDMDHFGYDLVTLRSTPTQKLSARAPANKQADVKPNFLFVGLGKTGSSLIDRVIRRHPDIFLSQQRKELNFFNFPRNFERGQSYYNEVLGEYNGQKLIGDVSPGYYTNNAYLDRIVEFYNGDVPKIILSVRNPVTQLYSRYNHVLKIGQYLSQGYIPGSFAEEIKRGEYFVDAAKQIKEVVDRLGGASNTLLLVYERDFLEDYKFEQKVYDFLGVDASQSFYDASSDSSVNSGLMPRIIPPKPVDWTLTAGGKDYAIPANQAFFCSTSRRTSGFLPGDKAYETITSAPERHESWGDGVSPDTLEYIRETQSDPIRQLLQKTFDVDLSIWDEINLPSYEVAEPPEHTLQTKPVG